MRHGYWTRRLTAMRRAGVAVTARRLRYRVERVRFADGTAQDVNGGAIMYWRGGRAPIAQHQNFYGARS